MEEGEWINPQWIRDRLNSSGRTQRELAKELGVDASQITRLLDGVRRLKADEIPIIRSFFEGGLGGPKAPEDAPGSIREARPERTTTKRQWPRGAAPSGDIPVFLLQPAELFYRETDRAAEYRPAPALLAKVADAFAMIIPDDRLEPRFEAGEVIYVHPNRAVIPGTFVVARYRDRSGVVVIGRVLEISGEMIRLKTRDFCHLARRPDEQFNRKDFGQIGSIVAVEMK